MANILSPIARPVKRCAYRVAGRVAGLTPIDRFDPKDIFIAGYPKSGNTWFQNLLAGVMFGVDATIASDALIQELVPDVHFKKLYKRFSTPCAFKTHHLPRPEYKRAVYLLRDGRDAMVSYYHYLETTTGQPVEWKRMIVDGEGLFPSRWHVHVKAWLEENPYKAEIITIRYEDLKRDPVKEMQRFCVFASLERDATLIRQSVERASFENMKKREAREGWEMHKAFSKDKPFMRRGKVGSYRDEMPAEVQADFMRQAGGTLKKYGYGEA